MHLFSYINYLYLAHYYLCQCNLDSYLKKNYLYKKLIGILTLLFKKKLEHCILARIKLWSCYQVFLGHWLTIYFRKF